MAETDALNDNPDGDTPGDDTPGRPDYVDEKYWDAEAGSVKVEDLAKAHSELGQRFSKGKAAFEESVTDDVRAKLSKELRPEIEKTIRSEISEKAPKSPNDYSLELADDSPMKSELDKIGLVILTEPPGDDFVMEDDKEYFIADNTNPLMPMARKLAHRAGYSNEEFVGLLAEYAQAEIAMRPTQEAINEVLSKTYEGLGEHGKDRFDYARGRLIGIVGEEGASMLWPADATPSPAGVAAIEKLVTAAGEPAFQPEIHAMSAKGNDELLAEARQLQQSDDYWNNTASQARVAEIFRRTAA